MRWTEVTNGPWPLWGTQRYDGTRWGAQRQEEVLKASEYLGTNWGTQRQTTRVHLYGANIQYNYTELIFHTLVLSYHLVHLYYPVHLYGTNIPKTCIELVSPHTSRHTATMHINYIPLAWEIQATPNVCNVINCWSVVSYRVASVDIVLTLCLHRVDIVLTSCWQHVHQSASVGYACVYYGYVPCRYEGTASKITIHIVQGDCV